MIDTDLVNEYILKYILCIIYIILLWILHVHFSVRAAYSAVQGYKLGPEFDVIHL